MQYNDVRRRHICDVQVAAHAAAGAVHWEVHAAVGAQRELQERRVGTSLGAWCQHCNHTYGMASASITVIVVSANSSFQSRNDA